MDGVWYVAYGSNTEPGRLECYLRGGRPPGASRTYPGCRDGAAPRETRAVAVPGAVYFATRSPVWGGGRAFHDPYADGETTWARAHLVTAGQFCDIAAQEMYRDAGRDLDLAAVVREGRQVLGGGRYETVACLGFLAGRPMLTFTAPWRMGAVPWRAPSAAYLRCLARGLVGAGPWGAPAVAAYLAGRPGAAGHWTRGRVLDLLVRA
ncbi:histone deacetylase [Streptomyces thermolilacinus]|uniref:histone deacetylase n=1 Tax=Streptomyces thermolilacinus TaxID=285540 RepID=UPI0033E6319F